MKQKTFVILGILASTLFILTSCSQKTTAPTSKIPNPMVRYDTLEQVENKMGYATATIPSSSGFELEDCYIIGDTLVDLRYQKTDGSQATVRTAKNPQDDISGYQNLTYQNESHNGTTYKLAQYPEDNALIATFAIGDMTYSLSAKGMDVDNFKILFNTLMDTLLLSL